MKAARVIALVVGAGIVAIAALAGAKFVITAKWRVSFEKTYYEPLGLNGEDGNLVALLHRQTGVKIPYAELSNYNEVIIPGLPRSFARPPVTVVEPSSYLATVWYYEPAFGIKNEDAYLLDILVRSSDKGPTTASFSNGSSVNLHYIVDIIYGNLFKGSHPAATYDGKESDWQILVSPNSRPYSGHQLNLFRISYYSGPHAGNSYYVLSKSLSA